MLLLTFDSLLGPLAVTGDGGAFVAVPLTERLPLFVVKGRLDCDDPLLLESSASPVRQFHFLVSQDVFLRPVKLF
jgi:hypothetical protein